jgi:hypothetical protein
VEGESYFHMLAREADTKQMQDDIARKMVDKQDETNKILKRIEKKERQLVDIWHFAISANCNLGKLSSMNGLPHDFNYVNQLHATPLSFLQQFIV